jgi:hypothetical protein
MVHLEVPVLVVEQAVQVQDIINGMLQHQMIYQQMVHRAAAEEMVVLVVEQVDHIYLCM